jgi:hypothetical protein
VPLAHRSWFTLARVARITVDVNDEWLDAAREVLGTDTNVATINAALHAFALRRKAKETVAALDSVPMDFLGRGTRLGLSRRAESVHAR